MGLFSPDLEFYHDTDGLQLFAEVRTGFGNLFAQNSGITRQLVSGTLQVFPVAKYGAIELGAHRFCHDEKGQNVFIFGSAKEPIGNSVASSAMAISHAR